MPEIKHNFTGGKMQKDLDERLVPNGQYKDAMNIQVSTSEGSDVGTAQNILGNSLISGQGFFSETANCVGSIADEKNDKLYYFVVDDEELIVNGGFDGNAAGWDFSAGWSYSNGKAVAVNAPKYDKVTQNNLPTGFIIPGDIYELRFTVSDYEQGTLKVNCYSENGDGFTIPGFVPENKEYVLRVKAKADIIDITTAPGDGYASKFWVQSYDDSVDFTGKIDNISVTKSVSYIVEYDTRLEIIKPVVVDTNNTVLSFHPVRLITGINVIDDMLFWTDNYSEPKKINIPRCIEGTDKSGLIHTKLINESRDIDIDSGIDLEEKHITVIRKSPRTAPTIELITDRSETPGLTYSGIMRITTDPGGLDTGTNSQNASSLWADAWSSKNHYYDFSQLTVGDWFRTNIETDINGDSGFTLGWDVGDTVVFKEFSGDTYDDVPSTPITDYTIKAKIISDTSFNNWPGNNFTDQVAELAPNGDFIFPNINGGKPLGYNWSNGGITYDSVNSKIVFDGVGNWGKVTGTPDLDFVYGTGNAAGVYKVKFEIQGMTTGSTVHVKLISNQGGASPHSWNTPTVTTNSAPGVPHEFDLTLDTALGSSGGNFSYAAGKFFIRTTSTTNNSFEILNISIERQDVSDAGVKLEVIGINGVPAMVPDGYSELKYAVDLLDEEENLFEFKFPRFAYRYQYEDKEYSAFSPFTEVAFLPGSFDFHPQKGYNLGMTNGLKEITIKGFVPGDGLVDDVVAVDILYKDEASPNIYVIDTIKNNQHGSDIWLNNEYTIESEAVKRVLPSNQLLRPWDAVPKKALAQEISGNRIIYGNYTQGFDLLKPGTNQEYYPDFNFSIHGEDLGLNTVKSIKSLREYQLGVVFVDKYGRETPVLSNASGLDKVAKNEAAKSNKMEVSFGNTVFPEDMEYFKFFVKETSGEYYNMTMDRWWDAEDGLAWLSFGSADINKIDIDTFLILKKGVESNNLVTEPARYKVLAIKTEAPDHIKTKKALIEERKHTFAVASTNVFNNTTYDVPLLGRDTFKMRYQPFASGPGSELHNIEDGILYVEFAIGSVVSKRYRVTGLTTDKDQSGVASGDAMFSVKLDKNLGDDVNFICDDPNDGLSPTKIVDGATVRVYKYTPENSSEFDGRFFVKVISDGVFVENVATTNAGATQYRTTLSRKLYYMGSDQALLHSEALTGQTLGLYQDASSGTGYMGYSGGGTNNDLGFGSFASFFRNYKYGFGLEALSDGSASISVGQYRFDDTTETDWKSELAKHTAQSVFSGNTSIADSDLKDADHSGWDNATNDASTRYGVFNASGEQTKGNVWFVDGGPYSGVRSSSEHSLHWDWTGQPNGVNNGLNIGASSSSIKIAMGGIYNPSAGTNIDYFYSIGTSSASGGWYSGNKFKDLVGKISPSVKFRFREDPTGEVYTIKPSGVTWENLMRWSDGGTHNPSGAPTYSGEYPWHSSNDPFAPMLSPNHTRGYYTRFTNDRTGDGTVTWDPTNGGTTGAIEGGLHLTATHSTTIPAVQASTPAFNLVVNDIHNITCSENGGEYSITKGMILTSYGNVTLDGTFTSPGTTNSHEPLIVSDIVPTGTGLYNVYLTGYSSPILNDDLGSLGLLKHKIWVTAPIAGDTLVFQQPAMNGCSQYSVNRINAQNAPGQGWSLSNPALLAVGYTVEFLEEIEGEVEFPDNPAIWETEPKETTDLDIYYEASGYNPLTLTEDTKHLAIPIRSGITHVQNPLTNLGMTDSTDAVVSVVSYTEVENPVLGNSGDITGWSITIYGAVVFSGSVWNGTLSLTFESPLVGGSYMNIGDQLLVNRPDGSSITVTIKGWNYEVDNRASVIYIEDVLHGPDTKYTLNWHNCYSFGNGVESNRIRDSFNLPYIANGVKASTTLDEHPYEQNLKYGLIYSGIYNGAVGINNLNQFIAAEKISKDINPTYGSIQKLKAGWGQGGDLITLCEDRVLKIMANKDALYNADGNPQLLSTNAVLGQALPYSGEFGISKNPESFASEAYRAYFTDRVRGTVMRLSMDGLTPISNHGMKDWFRDNLKPDLNLIGSYDDRQDEYNLTLRNSWAALNALHEPTTVSFREDVKGWVSFKSFIQENGVSCANGYYTFANGRLWKHHTESAEDVLTVTVTGIDHVDDATDSNGKYFFFELSELESVFPSLPAGWTSHVATVRQHRNGTLVRETGMRFIGAGGNSLLANSPSGGDTKGHGRYEPYQASNPGDWEVGDTITIGNWDRNTFYDAFRNSSLDVMLNDMPSSIKSYHTLEYEGSQSRVLNYSTMSVVNEFGNTVTLSDAEAYNLTAKDGWYVDNVKTNKQEGSLREFIEKEGKWFNYIKGAGKSVEEFDFGSFNIQGIGSGGRGSYIADFDTVFGGIVSIISFDNEINLSLQVGDTVYANDTLTDEAFFQTIDTANAVNCGTVTYVGSSWEDFISNYDEELWVEQPTTTPPMWYYSDGSVGVFTTTNPYQIASIVIVSQLIQTIFNPDSYYFFIKNQVINTSSLSGYYADVQFQNNSKVKAELFAVSSEVTESSK